MITGAVLAVIGDRDRVHPALHQQIRIHGAEIHADALLVPERGAEGTVLPRIDGIVIIIRVVAHHIIVQRQTFLIVAVIGLDIGVHDGLYLMAEVGLPRKEVLFGFGVIDSDTYNPVIKEMREGVFHDHKDGLTVFQPDLTYFAITDKMGNKYVPHDYHVWGKLIKTDLYKKSINNFGINAIGEDRNLCFVTWAEDCAMNMVLFSNAKSYKFIKKYGIFHYWGITTASNTSSEALKKYGELFFIDIIYDFTPNNILGKKYTIEIIEDIIFSEINNIYNMKNKQFLEAILLKMLSCQFISKEDKNEIKKKLDIINRMVI